MNIQASPRSGFCLKGPDQGPPPSEAQGKRMPEMEGAWQADREPASPPAPAPRLDLLVSIVTMSTSPTVSKVLPQSKQGLWQLECKLCLLPVGLCWECPITPTPALLCTPKYNGVDIMGLQGGPLPCLHRRTKWIQALVRHEWVGRDKILSPTPQA